MKCLFLIFILVVSVLVGCQSPSDCAVSCCDEKAIISQRTSEAQCISFVTDCGDPEDPDAEKSCVAMRADYYRSNCMLDCVK